MIPHLRAICEANALAGFRFGLAQCAVLCLCVRVSLYVLGVLGCLTVRWHSFLSASNTSSSSKRRSLSAPARVPDQLRDREYWSRQPLHEFEWFHLPTCMAGMAAPTVAEQGVTERMETRARPRPVPIDHAKRT